MGASSFIKCSLCEGGYGTKINEAMHSDYILPTFIISPVSKESLRADWGNVSWTSATWPAANRAMFIPFHVRQLVTVQQLWCMNGPTLNGNIDIGVYSMDTLGLIAHTGAKVQAGVARVQAIAKIFQLAPGNYFLAMSSDSGTGTFFRRAVTGTVLGMAGVLQQSTAFPLPETISSAAFLSTTTNAYLYGLSTRSFI